jgi:hypothetical protein
MKVMILLSLLPILYVLNNAEATLRKTKVKEMALKRRERLDQEHGVDRKVMKQDFEKLDNLYRISEKEEIEKYKKIGKSPRQYYDDKELRSELDDQKAIDKSTGGEQVRDEKLKKILQAKSSDGEISITRNSSEFYEQVEVGYKSESPDPRVGGTKIIFDTRLDKITENSTTGKLDAFMKVKSEQKQQGYKPKPTETDV